MRRALEAIAARDWDASARALEDALRVVREQAPLTIRRAIVINHDHTALGVYAHAPGDVVQDHRLRIYVEVENVGLARVDPAGDDAARGDDARRLQLDVEGTFAYVGQQAVLGTRSLGSHIVQTHDTRAVTSFGVDVKLADTTPPGDYIVTLVVHDRVAGKSAHRDVHFLVH